MHHCFVIVCHNQKSWRLTEILSAISVNHAVIVLNMPLGAPVLDWEIFQSIKNIRIIENFNIAGIAGGANAGAYFAIANGYELLTFLDDDSIPSSNFAEIMRQRFLNSDKKSVLQPKQFSKSLFKIQLLNHSGMTLSGQLFEDLDGFRESLFIDLVDYEFGWRIQLQGIAILDVCQVWLDHRLGQRVFKSKMLPNITVQSPLRHYYQARNARILLREAKGKFKALLAVINISVMLKLVFLVLINNSPKKRFSYFIKGLRDAK